MRIAFLLPNYSGYVVGSLLAYYGFARELARYGYQVDLIHPAIDADESKPYRRARAVLWSFRQNLRRRPIPWHEFGPGVRSVFIPRFRRFRLDHDIAIGFSWRGIEAMADLRFHGLRFGYVVEYESWMEADPSRKERMERAYRSGPAMLASSKVVEEMLRTVGVEDVRPCVLGVDIERFRSPIPPAERSIRIGFPVRSESVKSPEVLQATLEILRSKARQHMLLWGFGRPDAPPSIVGMLDEYHANPEDDHLASLYSSSAIFAIPSWKEGFGLPAAEAMAAGCAVVSTDNGGIHTFGTDRINCRIVPPNDPESLAMAILDLIDHPEQRIRLATTAEESVSFLSWTLAGKRLISALDLEHHAGN